MARTVYGISDLASNVSDGYPNQVCPGICNVRRQRLVGVGCYSGSSPFSYPTYVSLHTLDVGIQSFHE